MTINLDEIALNEATANVEFGHDTADIVYKPGLLTGANIAKMQTASEDDDGGLYDFLDRLLVDWDVERGKGKAKTKVPTTKEGLMTVPVPLLRKMLTAIMEHASLGEAENTSSAG